MSGIVAQELGEEHRTGKEIDPFKKTHAPLVGIHAALQEIEEGRITMAPFPGIFKVAQFPTVVALVRRGQHPAHADSEPGFREAAQ